MILSNWRKLFTTILIVFVLAPRIHAANYTLAPNISGGQGTIQNADGMIRCVNGIGTCVASYPAGMVVQLIATAGPNSTFVHWSSGAFPTSCGGVNPCTVTMISNLSPTAQFSPTTVTYTLAPNISGGQGTIQSADGMIRCVNGSGTCVASYPAGTVVQLIATAGPNSTFVDWSSGSFPTSCGGVNPCTVTMISNLSPTAHFTASGGPPSATFSLPVLYQGVQYDLYFVGNPNSYGQQTQHKSSPLGSQAQYLSAFLTNSVSNLANCCGITGVWIYSGGQPVAASKIPPELLGKTLLWAYAYLNFVLTPGGTQ